MDVASQLERLRALRDADALSEGQYQAAVNLVVGLTPAPQPPPPAADVTVASEPPGGEHSIFAAPGEPVDALPFAAYDKDAPRRQMLEKKAYMLLRKAPLALQHLHELRLSAENEVDPCSAQMSEATVMTAVEKALDAFDCHFKEQLEYAGAKLKLGRGGCYGPDRDRIERPHVSVVQCGSDTGAHSTNEGCLPELTRIVLLGDCRHGLWRNRRFENDSGFTYELLQKALKSC